MSPSFMGYTSEQAADIKQALIEVRLKPNVEWSRLLASIEDGMYNATCEDIRLAEETPPLVASKAIKRLKSLIAALDVAVAKHKQLGEILQWHLDLELPQVPLLRDAYSDEWRSTVRCLLSSDQFSDALNVVKVAAERAASKCSERFSRTGAPKDHRMREAVYELLNTFQWATGTPPTIYPSELANDGYAGNFYLFARAALTPVFPARNLGSAILTAYREWKACESIDPGKK